MADNSRDLPPWIDYFAIPVINVSLAFLISGLAVLAIGINPVDALQILIRGSIGYDVGIGYTLFYATDFVFTGLAVAVALHAGLFNIGVEGQALIAGVGTTIICLYFDALPLVLVVPIAIIMSSAFGAAWGFIPGYLQARRGSHVVITTIMLNFVATTVLNYLLDKPLKRPGSMAPESSTFAENVRLPLFKDIFSALNIPVANSPVNFALVFAILAAVAVWFFLWRSRTGYALRTVGLSPKAASYAGIDIGSIQIKAMIISGALAAGVALNQIMGYQNRLILDFAGGAGFVGIAVALMGRGHPFGICLAAILFGMLYQGGAELAFEIPEINRHMITVIQGLVILFAGALEHMFRPALVKLWLHSRKSITPTGLSPKAKRKSPKQAK